MKAVTCDYWVQIISMSSDGVIKLWDLRNNKRLQTIDSSIWKEMGERSPTCMVYDGSRRRLVCAAHQPLVLEHQSISESMTGHRSAICNVLFNSVFEVVSMLLWPFML